MTLFNGVFGPYAEFLLGLAIGLTIILPILGHKHLREDDDNTLAMSVNEIAMVIGAILLVPATLDVFTPGQHLIWWLLMVVYLVVAVIFVRAGMFGQYDYRVSAIAVGGLSVFAGVIMSLIKALDDNSWRLTNGTVVGQTFTPAHYVCVKTCTWVPDDWALTLRNCTEYGHCVVGVLHFGVNVFAQYKFGAYYP